ncbi:hypothetical protein [Pseudodesulfovibrio sediminis]|uniref:Uncharacterized protein n=1 Tax=Pseudodesulfovibrio sediminis TaxID=2810563 RepID=A0ABN6EW29_9BACT|nr:hypothetical protein [Pseudodesulfovibrio sediminis]BCS89053.1 hypothetical protein PSDVSF_22950 [Pseudodesulfovibrio sediminis]
MAGKRLAYPWSSWPPTTQQRFFKLVLSGTATAFFAVFVGVYLFTGTLDQQIKAEKAQYSRVVPIVQEINMLHARQGDLAHLSVEEATRRILDDHALTEHTISFHETRISETMLGEEMTMTGLTLVMVTDFLKAIRDRASLQTPEFALTRNPDDPRLADVHLVLVR